MNILYVDHYAGTPALGMEFRPYYLSREWVRMGHRVQVLAASYSHVRARQPTVQDVPVDQVVDAVEYRWYPTPHYRGNGFGRAWNIGSFLCRVWRDGRRFVREFRPDVVIASSTYPMDIWVTRRIARLARARLVFELHDVWPASLIELSGMSPRHPFARLCARAERDACRFSDVVISLLPNVTEHLAALGLERSKLHVVPNGIDPNEWERSPVALDPMVDSRLRAAREAGRVAVGYAGSHGAPNALDNLLDAAALLRDEPFEFLLVGDGHEKARLERRVRMEGLTHVALLPSIPKDQVPAFLGRLDIAYIGWRRLPIYRFGIAANKLMDYMMTGCAILHAVGAANDPVAEAGCGLSVAPESPEAVADGLRRLQAIGPAARAGLGAKGRAWVLAHRTWPVLARQFLDAVRARPAR